MSPTASTTTATTEQNQTHVNNGKQAKVDIGALLGIPVGVLDAVAKGTSKIIANPVNPVSVVSAAQEMTFGILSAVKKGVEPSLPPQVAEGINDFLKQHNLQLPVSEEEVKKTTEEVKVTEEVKSEPLD
ncbi:hypothetical protein BKA69DRAFT_1042016 [Paraphysoderma sedebokerense]|nr:hypothetical protein BKA69DRAFT_1042016 [Paraphysoderma sedebokerense]